MMQHARAHNQVEAAFQFRDALDRQRPYLEICEVVLARQLLGVIETGRADVNTDDAGVGPADGVFGRLPGSTSRDGDIQVRTVWPVRPKQMVFRPVAILILPLIARPIQILYRRRIRMAGVELGTPGRRACPIRARPPNA